MGSFVNRWLVPENLSCCCCLLQHKNSCTSDLFSQWVLINKFLFRWLSPRTMEVSMVEAAACYPWQTLTSRDSQGKDVEEFVVPVMKPLSSQAWFRKIYTLNCTQVRNLWRLHVLTLNPFTSLWKTTLLQNEPAASTNQTSLGHAWNSTYEHHQRSIHVHSTCSLPFQWV